MAFQNLKRVVQNSSTGLISSGFLNNGVVRVFSSPNRSLCTHGSASSPIKATGDGIGPDESTRILQNPPLKRNLMMNWVILRASSLQRAYLCHSLFSSKTLVTSPRRLGGLIRRQPLLCVEIQKPPFFLNPLLHQTRSCVSEMHKTEFQEEEEEEGNILRILENEILRFESEYAPHNKPVTKYGSFTVEDRPGEEWIRLTSKYGENEDIKIDVTMFDGWFSRGAGGGDGNFDGWVSRGAGGGDGNNNIVLFRISLIVEISKRGKNDSVFQFVCSAWPNYLKIEKFFVLRGSSSSNGAAAPTTPYLGSPDAKIWHDSTILAKYEYLEDRGVTNELADFLQEYMLNKDKTEFIRWMGKVKSFIELK